MSAARAFVALDLDGTLEDSRRDMVASIMRVRAHLGVPPRTYDALVPHVSRGMPHLYAHAFDDAHTFDGDPARDEGAARASEIQNAFDADYLAHICAETTVYAGITDALDELATFATLAVVTNKPEQHSRALLDALGLSRYFVTVVGGDTCAAPKPSALPFDAAFDASDMGPGTPRFMVGDSAGDVKTARAAGVYAVWCGWGYHAQAGDLAPDATCPQPGSLAEAIRSVRDAA